MKSRLRVTAGRVLTGLLAVTGCCTAATLSFAAVQSIRTAAVTKTPAAGVDGPPLAVIDAMHHDGAAFRWYMLNCAGCHRADGKGVPQNGVPSFVDSAGLFTWTPDGREYLIRVPGSATSHLSNKELAEVLNWIVATYSSKQLPSDFRPFSSSEVAAVRSHHYKDVVAARDHMDKELARLGLKPSLYLFGVNKWNKRKQSTR